MIPCESCGRHIRTEDANCPFCSTKPRRSSIFASVAAICTTAVLAACYGMPMDDTANGTDADADGFNEDVDCDDTNAEINPDALELCNDTIDNDCDELVDNDDEECDQGM